MLLESTTTEILRKPFAPTPWGLDAVKVIAREEIRRPTGYSLPGEIALAVTLEAEGRRATGYGEGEENLAYKRAYSEAIERLALFSLCERQGTSESSNGWAAHTSADLAIRAALFELIERDVALAAWENGGPFYLLSESLWPEALQAWKEGESRRAEYSNLQLLLSESENGACVSALLLNGRGNFVAGHASGWELGGAILSAAHECFRAAHSALRFEYLSQAAALHAETDSAKCYEPGVHSLAYAYRETIPAEILIQPITQSDAETKWKRHQQRFESIELESLDVTLMKTGAHTVARVKSPKYRQIFWGRCQDNSKRNLRPHFVG